MHAIVHLTSVYCDIATGNGLILINGIDSSVRLLLRIIAQETIVGIQKTPIIACKKSI